MLNKLLNRFLAYRNSEHYIRNNIVLLLGMVSATVYSLSSHTLFIWLSDLNVSTKALGFVSLGYIIHAMKILWIPIFEKFDIPVLRNHFDRRASWILFFILTSGLSIFGVSFLHPINNMSIFMTCIAIATFSMSVMDALLRAQILILSKDSKDQTTIVGLGTFGFRIGMFISIQLFILLSEYTSWMSIYRVSGIFIVLSSLLMIFLPKVEISKQSKSFKDLLILPYKDFVTRHKGYVLSVIGFMLFFKLQDRLLAPLNYKFFTTLHPVSSFAILNALTMKKIFSISKITAGIIMGFGLYASMKLIRKYNHKLIAFIGVILHSTTCLPLLLLHFQTRHSIILIFAILLVEKIVRAFSGNVYYIYQAKFCSKEYAAGQIAIITFLESIAGAVFGIASGFIVAYLSWTALIVLATVISLPVLIFINHLPEEINN